MALCWNFLINESPNDVLFGISSVSKETPGVNGMAAQASMLRVEEGHHLCLQGRNLAIDRLPSAMLRTGRTNNIVLLRAETKHELQLGCEVLAMLCVVC